MKKTIKIAIVAAALMLVTATVSKAQVFIQEDESSIREETEEVLGWPVNPQNNSQGNDDYVPVGDGLLLLTALGGARLIWRRKEETN